MLAGAPPVTADQPVVKTEEIKSPATHSQPHDPGLGRFRFQTEIGQQAPQLPEGSFGLRARRAHHQHVVGVTHQHSVLALIPCPVQPVQVDVSQQRGQHPALRSAGDRPADLPVAHHPCAQHHPQKLEHRLVHDAFSDRLHQLLMRNRLETVGDIRLDHPSPTPPGLINEHLQGIVRGALRAETVGARQHVGFKDRLEHDLQRGLHNPITHRRDGGFIPLLLLTCLGICDVVLTVLGQLTVRVAQGSDGFGDVYRMTAARARSAAGLRWLESAMRRRQASSTCVVQVMQSLLPMPRRASSWAVSIQ